jgi:cytochrome c5
LSFGCDDIGVNMKLSDKQIFILFLLIISGILGFITSLYIHQINSAEVRTIETFHYPSLFVKQLKNDPDAGRKIFKEFCVACHAQNPTIDMRTAPKIGDRKAWEARKKMGLDALMKYTISGIGTMPARGGCFECSDEQLRKTVEYILKNS